MAALDVVARAGIELPRYTKLHSTLVTQAVGAVEKDAKGVVFCRLFTT
jgi:hypothetical protein